MKRPALPSLAGFVIVAAAGVPACLSIERVDYHERPSPEAGPLPEAGTGDGSGSDPCRECIVTPGGACYPVFEKCSESQKCHDASVCAIEAHCLDIPELQSRIDCAVPCIQAAGISGTTDPALSLALDVNLCAVQECVGACAPLAM